MALFLFSQNPAYASDNSERPFRSNELFYQNPFDLAAGGASLTRATQEGSMVSNPSLPAFGAGLIRWIFLRNTVHAGADAFQFARDHRKSTKLDEATVRQLVKTPMAAGADVSAGAITSNASIVLISSTRVELEGREFGSVGTPEVLLRARSWNGLAISSAKEITDHFSFGTTIRPMYNGETQMVVGVSEISDLMSQKSGGSPLTSAKNLLHKGYGIGKDAGMTLQARSKTIDLRLAATVNDINGTKFNGGLENWKQTINVGTGFALHNRADALHCGIDYRDIRAAYQEHWTKRVYTGCKALVRSNIGFAAGFYQGWPTYGLVLNSMFVRLELGSYAQERGQQVGTMGRRIYFISLGAGFP